MVCNLIKVANKKHEGKVKGVRVDYKTMTKKFHREMRCCWKAHRVDWGSKVLKKYPSRTDTTLFHSYYASMDLIVVTSSLVATIVIGGIWWKTR